MAEQLVLIQAPAPLFGAPASLEQKYLAEIFLSLMETERLSFCRDHVLVLWSAVVHLLPLLTLFAFTNAPADCHALTVRTAIQISLEGREVCRSDVLPWPLLVSRWAAASRTNWATSVKCGFFPSYSSVGFEAGIHKEMVHHDQVV